MLNPSADSGDSGNSVLIDLALTAAKKSINLAAPNPRVGCVLMSADGTILGVGNTQKAGGPHAEIMALRDASQRGNSTCDAIAFVTLEPCSHHGRTGPCCDALIRAGIKKVVASIADPNPLVSGQGFARLQAAGIEVEVGYGAKESRELNIGFFSRMIRNIPWVRMKIAASLDGKTALNNGDSQWITSADSRADGHTWRARSCAILTGIGTIIKDDPKLDVRLITAQRQPILVIVDSRLETPLNSRVFLAERNLYIYTAIQDETKKKALEASGAIVIYLPDTKGQVNLEAMLKDLATREVNEVHVEAGQTLNGALINNQLVDEFIVYLAPKLLGNGLGMAQLEPFKELSDAISLSFIQATKIGPDLLIQARVNGHDAF